MSKDTGQPLCSVEAQPLLFELQTTWKIMFARRHILEARHDVSRFYPLGGTPVSKAVIV